VGGRHPAGGQSEDFGVHIPGIELIKFLGGGAFADVYLGRDTASGKLAAVKIMRNMPEDLFDLEVRILQHLSHQCIVGFCGYVPFESPTGLPPIVVMEYVPGQDLQKLIDAAGPRGKQQVSGWDFTQKFIVIYGVAVGLEEMHRSRSCILM
jgi:serine/threonine protein kinase